MAEFLMLRIKYKKIKEQYLANYLLIMLDLDLMVVLSTPWKDTELLHHSLIESSIL